MVFRSIGVSAPVMACRSLTGLKLEHRVLITELEHATLVRVTVKAHVLAFQLTPAILAPYNSEVHPRWIHVTRSSDSQKDPKLCILITITLRVLWVDHASLRWPMKHSLFLTSMSYFRELVANLILAGKKQMLFPGYRYLVLCPQCFRLWFMLNGWLNRRTSSNWSRVWAYWLLNGTRAQDIPW